MSSKQNRARRSNSKPRLTLIRVNERVGVHPFLKETNVSGVYPPLGVTYLAGAARAAGYPVSIIDAHAQNLSNQRLLKVLARLRPPVVGITSTTFNWPVAANLARVIRGAMPDTQIWVGGPQLTLFPDECMTEEAVDLAVIGEGDETIVELLGRVAAGEPLEGAPGTIVRTAGKDGELIRGPAAPVIKDLDSLPLPAVDLLPLSRYRALSLPVPFLSMVTSRGCPFRCRYCSQVYVGGKYREHSAPRVLEEVKRAVQLFGAREIIFFDETFTMTRERILEVCEGILDAGIKVRWNVRTRMDRLDEELLAAMHAAGCWSIHVGIESGSPRIQKLMNKRLKLDRLPPVLAAARRIGMETRGYFMLGYPGETRAEMEETIRLAIDLPLDWASFTITQPMAGTDIFHDALDSGLFPQDYWRDYTLGKVSESPGYFTSDEMDAAALEAMLRSAYRRFYLRPRQLLSKAKNPRLWRELPTIIETLLKVS